LVDSGLELTEVAPGINVERDILALMDFRPAIAEPMKIMPVDLFLGSSAANCSG
jgi:propionate CoA-transferase